MKIGYARVSTTEQHLDRQIAALEKAGCGRIYQEKVTGTKFDRPELVKLLDNIRAGDEVVITDLTRLSRSTRDLFTLSEKISGKGANLISLKENFDTTTPTGRMFFHIISALSEFEREIIKQRTKEGLAVARARGRVGGRRFKLSKEQESQIVTLYDSKKVSLIQICKTFKITKPTIYNILERQKKVDGK